jgi:hypothetical protein
MDGKGAAAGATSFQVKSSDCSMKNARREIHHSEITDRIKPFRKKKCPPTEDGHNPRLGPRDAESVRRTAFAARLSAITHIGCVYPDEPSIRSECDPGMTHLKQTGGSLRTNAAETGLPAATGKKKARCVSGLQTIFLEENSGDR